MGCSRGKKEEGIGGGEKREERRGRGCDGRREKGKGGMRGEERRGRGVCGEKREGEGGGLGWNGSLPNMIRCFNVTI